MTLTKEWLLTTIAELEEERDATQGAVNEDAAMALEAMKRALASLEAEKIAEPVAKVETVGFCWYADNGVPRKPAVGTELYAAPPAPVSVPDDVMAAMQKVARIRLDLDDFDGDKRGILDCLGDAEESLIEVVNRRAAMLQGAEHVSNRDELPDGWVACSERMPEEGDDMIVFTDDIVMSGVSYSKKKGFYLQALGYDDDEPVDNVTHWMPLPAAPQQEVK